MKITYFFRKKNPNAFSIEKLFHVIIQHLPEEVKGNYVNVLHYSSGLFSVFFNALFANKNQQEINHITGDIHYIALFLKKSKTILTIHDLLMLEKGGYFKQKIFKLLWFIIPIKRVKYVTVISEATKMELLERVKFDPEKIVVIPNCIDPSFQPVPKVFNEQLPVILTIGTKENKNLPRIIEAINGVRCKLKIIGRLPLHISQQLNSSDILYENVFNLSDDEIKQAYIDTDLLIFASLKEGFGLPIIEAQAIGRPVITSNTSSMPEVANNSALLINPYDVQEIRHAVQSLIQNKHLREELIQKGFENIKRYHPNTIANKYFDLYKAVLDGK